MRPMNPLKSVFKNCAAILRNHGILLIAVSVISSFPAASRCEIRDPLDPFEMDTGITTDEQGDRDKSSRQLILEATVLLDEERLLDARTKLLRALQRDPGEYLAHMMLSGYYLEHVGHFRLALKYAKRAMELFYQKAGYPPYMQVTDQKAHQQLLYLLSQVRLNLDEYDGALRTLDEFLSYGYTAPWYPGSRAWVLMKLGRVEEAIKVARIGMIDAGEPGRTLNMLGILLSMHGEREASLQIFRQAIAYELSQGQQGQPATPLNNSGEVYKEIFREDEAERAWLRATSLPDGCEHVLPSLNLALLYIDQMNLPGAKRALDSFEACVAQYPLRNGEEHKSLVALARGRIAMRAGRLDEAEKLLLESLEKRQWFGKIGTDPKDLEVALFISLGQLHETRVNHIAGEHSGSLTKYISSINARAANHLKSWWYFRKAAQLLSEDLKDLEDLYVRNTDSLIEYTTFGQVLSVFPRSLILDRIDREQEKDDRSRAAVFYDLYRAEVLIKNGSEDLGIPLVYGQLEHLRHPQDGLLYVHAITLLLHTMDVSSPEYAFYSRKAFQLSPASLRNAGLKLPVIVRETDGTVHRAIHRSPFLHAENGGLLYSIRGAWSEKGFELSFESQDPKVRDRTAVGNSPEEAVDRLADAVFSEVLQ